VLEDYSHSSEDSDSEAGEEVAEEEGVVLHSEDEDVDVEKAALEAIGRWHQTWTLKLSDKEGDGADRIKSKLEGQDVFLVHNIDYLKRRHRFKSMFAKLKIDASVDDVLPGSPPKTGDEMPSVDHLIAFDEAASLAHFKGNKELLREMADH